MNGNAGSMYSSRLVAKADSTTSNPSEPAAQAPRPKSIRGRSPPQGEQGAEAREHVQRPGQRKGPTRSGSRSRAGGGPAPPRCPVGDLAEEAIGVRLAAGLEGRQQPCEAEPDHHQRHEPPAGFPRRGARRGATNAPASTSGGRNKPTGPFTRIAPAHAAPARSAAVKPPPPTSQRPLHGEQDEERQGRSSAARGAFQRTSAMLAKTAAAVGADARVAEQAPRDARREQDGARREQRRRQTRRDGVTSPPVPRPTPRARTGAAASPHRARRSRAARASRPPRASRAPPGRSAARRGPEVARRERPHHARPAPPRRAGAAAARRRSGRRLVPYGRQSTRGRRRGKAPPRRVGAGLTEEDREAGTVPRRGAARTSRARAGTRPWTSPRWRRRRSRSGDALGRVLAADLVLAPGDVPAFDRSNVDGWAVRAEDTFGADGARRPCACCSRGGADRRRPRAGGRGRRGRGALVATGAVLPRGADAVVMVEDTELEAAGACSRRPASRARGISAAGSDVARGEVVLRAGTRLTARETGTLAACGFAAVAACGARASAVISTGDEIVPPGAALAPGQVHDANATLVADAARELGRRGRRRSASSATTRRELRGGAPRRARALRRRAALRRHEQGRGRRLVPRVAASSPTSWPTAWP